MGRVVVLGAGAAGLSAARRLRHAGHGVTVLEASGHLGGRARTDYTRAEGLGIELGAEFIHGARTSTRDHAREAGLDTVPVPRFATMRWADRAGEVAVPLEQQPAEVSNSIHSVESATDNLANVVDITPDVSLGAYLSALGVCPDTDARARARAEILLAQTCCARLDELSVRDMQRELKVNRERDVGAEHEARVRGGYSRLMQWYAQGTDIVYNAAATRVEWALQATDGSNATAQPSASAVRVHTSDGRVFAADACVVAVPVTALQRQPRDGGLQFEPPLSARKLEAISSFRMHAATKLVYVFRQRMWDEGLAYMCHPGRAPRWWTPAYGLVCGDNAAAVKCCYATADRAEDLDALPESDALSIGLAELCRLLGVARHDMEPQLQSAFRVSWAMEPYILGGYAIPIVGAGTAREDLAAPEDGVLFFCGEATAYDSNPQTVHGAVDTGLRAAAECTAALADA